jgi:hypothetical protein
MTNIELGFSALLAALIALPAVARLSAVSLDWLFAKIAVMKKSNGRERQAKLG